MKTAEPVERDHLAVLGQFDGSPARRVSVERHVRTVVAFELRVVSNASEEMTLAEHDQVIGQAPTERSDQPLGVGILPRRTRRDEELASLGFRTRSGRPDRLLLFAEAFIGSFATSAREARFSTEDELDAKARAIFVAASNDPVEAIPPEFVMIARVIGTLAGLFTHYRPTVDIARGVVRVLARGMAN